MSENRIEMRKATVIFVFITVTLDMLAFGIVIPVLPKLIESFVIGNVATAAMVYGALGVAWAFMQFLFSPLLGALSDHFGRRPVILLSCFGLGLDYMLMAVAPTLFWLFLGRLLSGASSANIATAAAYVTDVTPIEKRAGSLGMLGAAMGIGFVLGPAFGGILGGIDLRLPFWVAAVLCIINAIYGYFVLPESLAHQLRTNFSWKRANPIGALVLLRSHPELTGLAVAHFLVNFARMVLPATGVLYMSYRYGWSPTTIGLTFTGIGICIAVVHAGLIKPAVAWGGERRVMLLGLIFGVLGFMEFFLASTEILFWLGIPLLSLWGLADPTMESLMTRRVSVGEQGQLQGAIASLAGIAQMIGPGVFSLVFAGFIGPFANWHLPSVAFLLAAMLLMGSALVAWRATRPKFGVCLIPVSSDDAVR